MKTIKTALLAAVAAFGALCPSAATADAANGLLHRWSFNDNCNDSVGTLNATPTGASFVDNKICLTGGANGTSFVSIPAEALPTDKSFTIEIFAVQREVDGYSRIFSFGKGDPGNPQNELHMTWSRDSVGTDEVYALYGGNPVVNVTDSMAPYSLDTEWHIALTYIPTSDGKGRFYWRKAKVGPGDTAFRERDAVISSGADLKTWEINRFWLGRSYWTGDNNRDAQADYDEVRIWEGALTSAQLAENAMMGPNEVPTDVKRVSQVSSRTMSISEQTDTSVTFAFGGEDWYTCGLYMASGTTDGGDDKGAWTDFEKVTDVTGDQTTYTYKVPAKCCDGRKLRFFLMQTTGIDMTNELKAVTSAEGEQVKTGVMHGAHTCVDFRFGKLTSTGTATLFGGGYNNSQFLFIQQGPFQFWGNGKGIAYNNPELDYRLLIGDDNSVYLTSSDGVTVHNDQTNPHAGSGNEIAIFACNNGSYKAAFTFYRMKIGESGLDKGNLVRDFVPAVKDNVAGLYDNVNNVFYKSSAGQLRPGEVLQEGRFGRVIDSVVAQSYEKFVLAEDTDWTSSAEIPSPVNIDLNGHKLKMTADASKYIAFVGNRGVLDLVVTNGEFNVGTYSYGAYPTKIVKHGAGTLVINKDMRSVTNFVVEEGILKPSTSGVLGAVNTVTVKDGAAYDLAGFAGNPCYVLIEGVGPGGEGALRNTGNSSFTETQEQVTGITLTSNALIKSNGSLGLIASSYGGTKMELNGHALTIEYGQNAHFWMVNVSGDSAGTICVKQGVLRFYNSQKEVSLPNVDVVIDGPAAQFFIPEGSASSKITFRDITVQNGGRFFNGLNRCYMQNFKVLDTNPDAGCTVGGGVAWIYVAKDIVVSNEVNDLTIEQPFSNNGTYPKILKYGAAKLTLAPNYDGQYIRGGAEIFGGTVVMDSRVTGIEHRAISTLPVPVTVHSGGTLDMRKCSSPVLISALTLMPGGTVEGRPMGGLWTDPATTEITLSGQVTVDLSEGLYPSNTVTTLFTAKTIADRDVTVAGGAEGCSAKIASNALVLNTIPSNCTLTENADWTTFDMEAWAGKTINLNGHELCLTANADITSATTITSGTADGVLRIVVPDGKTVTNTGLALSGSLRLVKDGRGAFYASKANQTYTGGTEIGSGTLYFGTATAPCGTQKTEIKICKGATLDMNELVSIYNYDTAGTIRMAPKNGVGYSDDWKCFGPTFKLSGDAKVTGNLFYFACPDQSPMNFTMNGHTLTLESDGYVGIGAWRATDGGAMVFARGQFEWLAGYGPNSVDVEVRSTATFKLGGNFDVKGFRYDPDTWSKNSGVKAHILVLGVWRATSYRPPVLLCNNSTIDLSGLEGPLDTDGGGVGCESGANGYVGFDANATVAIDVGGRVIKNGDKLITWASKPSATFALPTGTVGALEKRGDGLYVTCDKIRIGTTYYLTLAAAVGAAQEGDKIELLADVDTGTSAIEVTKNITLDGAGYELTGAGFAGSGTLTITGGRIGVTGLPDSYALQGGFYKETVTWTADSGYHFVEIEGATSGSYAKQVVSTGGGKPPADQKAYPIVVGEQTIGMIAVSETQLRQKGYMTDKHSTVQDALADEGANHNKTWENVVLGLSNADASAKPVVMPQQTSSTTHITFMLGGVTVDETTGAKVTYKVWSGDSPGSKMGTPSGEVPYDQPQSMPLPAPGVKYYLIETIVTPAK